MSAVFLSEQMAGTSLCLCAGLAMGCEQNLQQAVWDRAGVARAALWMYLPAVRSRAALGLL